MLGAGGVFVVALSAYFGRLPVMFWYLIVAFATAAWCAGAKSFESFMAARILNGFFSTVAQGGGLMFVSWDVLFLFLCVSAVWMSRRVLTSGNYFVSLRHKLI